MRYPDIVFGYAIAPCGLCPGLAHMLWRWPKAFGLRNCAIRQISTLDGQVNTWCHVLISGN